MFRPDHVSQENRFGAQNAQSTAFLAAAAEEGLKTLSLSIKDEARDTGACRRKFDHENSCLG